MPSNGFPANPDPSGDPKVSRRVFLCAVITEEWFDACMVILTTLRVPFSNAQPPFQGVKISRFWDTLGDTLEESCPILFDTLD